MKCRSCSASLGQDSISAAGGVLWSMPEVALLILSRERGGNLSAMPSNMQDLEKNSIFQASTIKSVRSCGQDAAENHLQWQVPHSWEYTNHQRSKECQVFRSDFLVPNLGPQIDSSIPTCPCRVILYLKYFRGMQEEQSPTQSPGLPWASPTTAVRHLPWDLSCSYVCISPQVK